MGANIEIKARARSLTELQVIAKRLAGVDGVPIEQEDVFFHAPHGRLKLRIFSAQRGELIAYRREDRAGAKTSEYVIVPTDAPAELRAALTAALGVRVIVKKLRHVFVVGQTRIHLDHVDGLGEFIELEYVLRPDEDRGRGTLEVARLVDELGIREDDFVATAYADMLVA